MNESLFWKIIMTVPYIIWNIVMIWHFHRKVWMAIAWCSNFMNTVSRISWKITRIDHLVMFMRMGCECSAILTCVHIRWIAWLIGVMFTDSGSIRNSSIFIFSNKLIKCTKYRKIPHKSWWIVRFLGNKYGCKIKLSDKWCTKYAWITNKNHTRVNFLFLFYAYFVHVLWSP